MGERHIHQQSAAGKWGGAVSILEGEQTAQEVPRIVEILDANTNDSEPQPNVYTKESQNENHIMLYSVGHKVVTREMCKAKEEVPFKHTLQLLGPKGEVVRVSALFDGAAMVGAMCQSVFKKIKHRLEGWKKSERLLRMANGVLVPSQAVWKGVMWLGGIEMEGSFEVFDSGGNWAFLLGKPLLRRFNAEQDFSSDTVIVHATPESTPINLCNKINQLALRNEIIGMNLTLDVKQAMVEKPGPNIQSILTRGHTHGSQSRWQEY